MLKTYHSAVVYTAKQFSKCSSLRSMYLLQRHVFISKTLMKPASCEVVGAKSWLLYMYTGYWVSWDLALLISSATRRLGLGKPAWSAKVQLHSPITRVHNLYLYMCISVLLVFSPDCRAVCHTECKSRVPLPCVHAVHTPKKKLKVSVNHYSISRMARVHCIFVWYVHVHDCTCTYVLLWL